VLKTKNISPQKLAAFISLPVSLVATAIALFYNHEWYYAAALFVILFVCGYAFTYFLVKRFLYDRIKLIYKLIAQTKAGRKEELYNQIMPQKTLDEVGEDVDKWAAQRSEELEVLRKNEAYRKEFLLNLSHELKTPIFSIQGYVHTLLGGALNNPEVNEKFLENASKNIDRLVNLLDDLDEISKLEMGEQKLNKQSFVIQDAIKEVYESLTLKADAKKISCFIRKECETPVTVFADKEKIKQVLINFVDNAIKYGKQNGEVESSVYKIDEGKVLVEISDNGSGISEEHLPRIFERFYRTDQARARKIGGSGLGLSICKHIIEAHGEALHVRSKPDVGSTFGFTLPVGRN
jgi:two-component system, OmpR family, phosphate regulon sensor histidine kinase PhoR